MNDNFGILNLPAVPGGDMADTPELTHKTIGNNVCHLTEELLHEINAIVAQHVRNLISKERGRGNRRQM